MLRVWGLSCVKEPNMTRDIFSGVIYGEVDNVSL
jgi:hypothetical protein